MNSDDRHLKLLDISHDLSSVSIQFDEIVTLEPIDENAESDLKKIPYSVDSPIRPHKDLYESMKKLRKHALELLGLDYIANDPKNIKPFTVCKIKIAGDYLMKQSRVKMWLSMFVEDTGKIVSIEVPETTMYGESKYHNIEKMTAIIEDIVEETWSYLEGKNGEDEYKNGQLVLFPARNQKPVLKKSA